MTHDVENDVPAKARCEMCGKDTRGWNPLDPDEPHDSGLCESCESAVAYERASAPDPVVQVRARDLSDASPEEYAKLAVGDGGDELGRATLNAFVAIQRQAQEQTQAVMEFVELLVKGVDPMPATKYGGKLSAAAPFADGLVNAFRRDQGKPDNPFSQGTVPARMFDRLLEADGPVTAHELARIGGPYQRQVTNALRPLRLAAAGWRLEKSKVAGKVAYELVRVPEEVAS